MSQDKQFALNQPFEFQEALLSPMERSRIQKSKGPLASQLFDAEPGRLEVKEYRLQEFSIRLRTINNACDAMASLPNGIPLTEVSIYGSRDRQYVVGPYSAVKRLMAGWVPQTESPFPDASVYGQKRRLELNSATNRIACFIEEVEGGRRVMGVYLDSFQRDTKRIMVQLAREDLEFLRDAYKALVALTLVFPPEPQPPAVPAHWWMPWTRPEDGKNEVDEVMGKADEVLSRLETQVAAPE
jgi:hypothetical protein